jgi:hypothetical protein
VRSRRLLHCLPQPTDARAIAGEVFTMITSRHSARPTPSRRATGSFGPVAQLAPPLRNNRIGYCLGVGAPVYFYDSRPPWQRGTNENPNGLLCGYFPKASASATTHRLTCWPSSTNSTADPTRPSNAAAALSFTARSAEKDPSVLRRPLEPTAPPGVNIQLPLTQNMDMRDCEPGGRPGSAAARTGTVV